MDSVDVIFKLQRSLKKRLEMLSLNVTSGGVDNMETYKYTIGQINALEAIKQEISDLLENKEQNDGNIVDIGNTPKT
jgi:predicted ATP-dependent protease